MQIFHSLKDPAVATALTKGAIGVIPTDTVYGLVCCAVVPQAVERLLGVKQRLDNPGTILAATVEQLVELGLKRRYLTAVAEYWPGAVSVVIPTGGDRLAYLHRGLQSLAIRLPEHNDVHVQTLLAQTGPLMTTSANLPGQPVATTIAEARAYFGDAVDFYVDGGVIDQRAPSTIIRVVDDCIEVLREGAVTIDPSTYRLPRT